MAAFFGMATMYAEGLLAIKYRTKDDHGAVAGGPMHYILLGMGEKWRPFNNLLGTLCLYHDFGMELLRGTVDLSSSLAFAFIWLYRVVFCAHGLTRWIHRS